MGTDRMPIPPGNPAPAARPTITASMNVAQRQDSSGTATSYNGYALPAGTYDEMVGPNGEPRPHWQVFLRALGGLGLGELTHRWEEARQLIRENGVTYDIYGDPRGLDRPWELDPVPLVIAPADGEALETGVIQRARLLELILADLYGPQKLLRDNLLPADLVFAHPGFLRPCHGLRVPGNRHLQLYAADLGRSPNGQVWVLADRSQAQAGAGYALENRIVLARMLPDVFRECQVQRLALFFRSVRETLSACAPHNRDNPRIVLLTPGPYSPTYFEHAYLARYLGYTLVEGGDLTVRDNRVYLKLLGGLQPVDVILRRLDDDLCDPLELRGDSLLGVAGLVQAVRAGNVAVANPLGSGLAETPALMPFLPALCRNLLGEELKLPSLPTWWCGAQTGLDHVLANLPQLVIKAAFPSGGFDAIVVEKLSREQRQALVERIRARPRDYVGQEKPTLSTTPVLAGNRLEPWPLVMRTFLAAADGSFTAMPGGLTRVAPSADTLAITVTRGGGSKDTWVLSPGPVSTFSLLRPTVQPVELSRAGGDLPSRSADNLFWLGRYVERADGMVRLHRGILARLTEKSGVADAPELPILLRALGDAGQAFPVFRDQGTHALTAPEGELLALVFDARRPGSLTSILAALHRVAGMVRDRLSTDTWRILQSLDLPFPGRQRDKETRRQGDRERAEDSGHAAPGHPGGPTLSEVLALLDQQVLNLAAFGGLAMESMTRGQAWRFLDMGRRLERALHTLILLRRTLVTVSGTEGPLLEALLEIADSSMTYRRRYRSSLHTAPVLDLLLADESNPRSLAFQLAALAEHVDNLPQGTAHPRRSPEQRLMMTALMDLRLADIDVLARANDAGLRADLDSLLRRLEAELPVLSDTITRNYLSHAQASRQLATLGPDPLP
jgi:uncharacterized circularly permuted ATP-grasp superfamily protein/uncharacterized alpha-E superfamily protein